MTISPIPERSSVHAIWAVSTGVVPEIIMLGVPISITITAEVGLFCRVRF